MKTLADLLDSNDPAGWLVVAGFLALGIAVLIVAWFLGRRAGRRGHGVGGAWCPSCGTTVREWGLMCPDCLADHEAGRR